MRKIYQSFRFNDKNAFSYYFSYFSSTCTHGRMCAYGRYAPEIIAQIHQIFHFYTRMSDVCERAFIFTSPDNCDTYSIMSGFY